MKTPPKSHRILTKITPSHSAYQRTLQQNFQAPIHKNVEFRIFCQKTNHGCVFICLFFFSQGSSYRPSGPRMSQEGSFKSFLSDQKNWRAPRPPPTLIFSPKSTDQNFEIAILFRIVKNHNNYVFGNDLLPHSPWGRGCKLQTSTSVYI